MVSQIPTYRVKGTAQTLGTCWSCITRLGEILPSGTMVFARRWLLADDGHSATVLEAVHIGSNESLRLALYRGLKSSLPLTLLMKATIKAWDATLQLACPSYLGISSSAPLWMNPDFLHFHSLPDPMIWASKGIKTLGDYTREGELLTYDQLKAKHDLPNFYQFCFFQLRHAFQSQYSDMRVETLPSALKDLLLAEDLAKPLSVTYKDLFKKSLPAVTR